jgi:two-component system NtrC family response regulator
MRPTVTSNVRELESVIKRAVIGRRHTISAGTWVSDKNSRNDVLNLRQVREEAEKGAVLQVLGRVNGNLSKASELLGISRPTLYDLMDRFGLR